MPTPDRLSSETFPNLFSQAVTLSRHVTLRSVMTDIAFLESIDLSSSYEAMRETIMGSRHACLAVFDSASHGIPRGYVSRKRLAIELLTGNRPCLERLIESGPSFTASTSLAEAASCFGSCSAHLGFVLSEGLLVGIVTPGDIIRGQGISWKPEVKRPGPGEH